MGVELDGAGDDHMALAVNLNAAALVDQRGINEFGAGELGDESPDAAVALP